MIEPTFELTEQVRPAIGRHALRTPLIRSDWLSQAAGAEVYLKCENLQRTGSFKFRGALAAISQLGKEDLEDGVVACSAGNHGLGLALAAKIVGVSCKVVVSRSVPKVKVDGIKRLGAEVVVAPCEGYDRTQAWTVERLAELGGRLVHPFDDAAVVAGNGGSTMMEVMEDGGPMDAVVVPCGGGGCVAGVGLVAKKLGANTRVVAVNAEASPGMWMSFRDGRAHLAVDGEATLADGLEGGVSEYSYGLARRWVDEVVLASEAGIRSAVAGLAGRERLVVEGAGAAGVAALLEGRVSGGRVCVFLTGGNIDADRLGALLGGGGG